MGTLSQADGLAKLAQAAAELAKAAATLSEAAHIVANMFSGESDNTPSGFAEGVAGTGVTRDILDEPAEDVELSARITEQSGIASNDSFRPYHIFVDYETDVLVYACAFIQNHKKVICYLQHSVSTLELYATLFRAVSPTLVYTVENTTREELDRVGGYFLNADHSVLLLPETICPNIELPESDSWVIHVGWPVDMLTYRQHIQVHKPRNNLFIAHPDDRRTRVSGVDPTHQSIPWPGDVDSISQTASALRPSFKQKLMEVPVEMKESAYLDYISCHGPRGHRNCSWDPSSLAYYANLYLLDVLQYMNPENDGKGGMEVEPSLPEVSPEFVKHHGLEPAVRDGVIRIKEVDPGLNHMSSLPRDDYLPTGGVVLNETNVPEGRPPGYRPPQGAHRPGSDLPDTGTGPRSPGQNDSRPLPSSAIKPTEDEPRGQSQSLNFNPWAEFAVDAQPRTADSPSIFSQSNLVREYIIVEAEFDIIPTICHLARQESVTNAICFVKYLNATEALIDPMKKIVSKPIHVVRSGTPINKALKKALQSASGSLIFCDMFDNLHPELSNKAFDLVIHVGMPENDTIFGNHTQLPDLRTSNIILSRKEVTGSNGSLPAELRRMGVSAIDATTKRDLNRQTELSTIASERVIWRDSLASVSSAAHVRSYYMAWIIYHISGSQKRQDWTAFDVVNNANRHVKEVLLHGYGKQGNPVRGRPAVTVGFVAHFKLEDAVAAGILTAKG